MRAAWLLALGVACTGDPEPDECETTDEPELVGPEDGRYVVGFQRGGEHFGLGSFTIRRNRVRGTVRSGDGLDLDLTARVLADGTVRLDELTVDSDHAVEMEEGRAASGFLEGTYRVDGELGHFAGRRVSGVTVDSLTDDFDGAYEIAILLADAEVAASVAHVRHGVVDTILVDTEGVVYDVAGFVTSDGTFVLTNATASDGDEVLAEATIDQDTLDVFGVYRSGDRVGRIIGRRAD